MQLHEKHKDQGLVVATLNMEGETMLDQANSVARKLKLTTTNWCLEGGMGDESLAWLDRPDGLLPAVNLYDRSGALRYKFEGMIEHAEVEQRVHELLAE